MSRERPVKSIQELRGKVLALANPQSLVAMRGMHWLKERGLVAGTDYEAVKAANEDSLGQMLVKGDSRLAMLSSVEFRQVPEEHKRQLEVFVVFAEVPSFVWLLNGRFSATEAAAMRARLLTLEAAEEGKKFFSATGIQGWREIGDVELAALDAYLADTRRLLGIAK